MDDNDELECSENAHYFDSDDDGSVPPYRECLCGEVTWQEMDDLLMLTKMLEITIE